jgi:hypothetical protein
VRRHYIASPPLPYCHPQVIASNSCVPPQNALKRVNGYETAMEYTERLGLCRTTSFSLLEKVGLSRQPT